MRSPLAALACALVATAAALGNATLTIANDGDVVFSLLTLLAILPYVATGFLVAWRRPAFPIGWLVLALPLSFGTAVALGQYALFAERSGAPLGPIALWLAFWLWVPGWLALGLVFLLFPDGRLPSARWRPVVAAIVVATGIALLTAASATIRAGPRPVGRIRSPSISRSRCTTSGSSS